MWHISQNDGPSHQDDTTAPGVVTDLVGRLNAIPGLGEATQRFYSPTAPRRRCVDAASSAASTPHDVHRCRDREASARPAFLNVDDGAGDAPHRAFEIQQVRSVRDRAHRNCTGDAPSDSRTSFIATDCDGTFPDDFRIVEEQPQLKPVTASLTATRLRITFKPRHGPAERD